MTYLNRSSLLIFLLLLGMVDFTTILRFYLFIVTTTIFFLNSDDPIELFQLIMKLFKSKFPFITGRPVSVNVNVLSVYYP